FFAAAPFTLVCNVIHATEVSAEKITKQPEDAEQRGYMYYINDGVYGSFNCILFDHVQPEGVPLFDEIAEEYPTTIWGPTCDSLDKVEDKKHMRRLSIGDWIMYPNMGAYTCSASTTFNGFQRPTPVYGKDFDFGLHLICEIDKVETMKLEIRISFFAAAPFTLVCNVIHATEVSAEKITKQPEDAEQRGYMYYINDGVYGSFNCILFDHVQPEGVPLFDEIAEEYPTTIWGPTCDSLDKVEDKKHMRRLSIGDWIMYPNMGAYTCSASTTFNGFQRPTPVYGKDFDFGLHLICEIDKVEQ
ncbi:Pyridoxal-dependent decarboxylase, sheet domain protein, partial [Oesophagostomum dentatum]